MPAWLIKFLAFVYMRIPVSLRPYAKRIFHWIVLRAEARIERRKIFRGQRIVFVENEIADLEDYEFLGPGRSEVSVRVEATVISPGTETAVLCGLPGARRSFPYYPGYSCVGIVDRVGPGVTEFSEGQRVVGRIGHASRATVNCGQLFSVPDNVDSVSASFIELGIIALQGIRKARISPGDRIVVLGQGLIGQLCNRITKLMGASDVVAVATSQRRKAVALRQGGADRFVALQDDHEVDCLDADVVLEAVGQPDAIAMAMRCARQGGTVSLIGSARGLSWDFSIQELIQNQELEVIGSHISAMPNHDQSKGRWTYRAEGELFLRLLEAGLLSVDELVTWIAQPIEGNAVYECLAHGGDRHVGIVFDWRSDKSANDAFDWASRQTTD